MNEQITEYARKEMAERLIRDTLAVIDALGFKSNVYLGYDYDKKEYESEYKHLKTGDEIRRACLAVEESLGLIKASER